MIRRFNLEEEQQIAGIKAYWDSRSGHAEVPPIGGNPDPDLQETIERIHALDDAPHASTAFRKGLLARLMEMTEIDDREAPQSLDSPAVSPQPLAYPVRLAEEPRKAGARLSRMWTMASVGSVALVLLAIVAGFVMWSGGSEPERNIVPLRTITTEDGVVIRTLVEEPVPAGILTTDPTRWIASFKFTLEPGEAWRDEPSPCELSRQYVVGLVEAGALSMINTGPFEIRRSDGRREQIAAGQRGDVHAGDSWVYFSDRTETNVLKWNAGSAPMVAYQTDWSIDESCEATPMNPEWNWSASTIGLDIDTSLPLIATIEQVFVGPGEPLTWDDAVSIGLQAVDSGVFSVVGIESGVLEYASVPTDLIAASPWSNGQQRSRTLKPGDSWSPQKAPPVVEGFEWQFRNGSDDTLVMTSISWSYDVGEFPAAAADDAPIARTPLIEAPVAAGVIPREGPGQLVFARIDVPAGESLSLPESCGVPIMQIGYIESGAYSIAANGSGTITRSDGETTSIDAGAVVEIAAGDNFTYLSDPSDTLDGFRNAGSVPLEMIQALWFGEAKCSFGAAGSPERSRIDWIVSDRLAALSTSPGFDVQIQVLELPAHQQYADVDLLGFALPAAPGDNAGFLIIEEGTVFNKVEMESGNAMDVIHMAELGPGEVVQLGGSLSLGSATESHFSAIGNAPARVLVISVVYGDAPG